MFNQKVHAAPGGKGANKAYCMDHGSQSHILEQPHQISSISIKGFMVDSRIHFKVVPTKSIPLLTIIQLGNDAWSHLAYFFLNDFFNGEILLISRFHFLFLA